MGWGLAANSFLWEKHSHLFIVDTFGNEHQIPSKQLVRLQKEISKIYHDIAEKAEKFSSINFLKSIQEHKNYI